MKYPQLVSMPSEISGWLEEQLEARGIDAIAYTRYILSLFDGDPEDVLCSDQDLHGAQSNKEVKQFGTSRKHFRCFTEWRDHVDAEAEKLKRSVAIECLMSASDQKSGIETLVDELCEKLRKIKSSTSGTGDSPGSSDQENRQAISPQDLVRKYYAAFPPLSSRSVENHGNIVSLIPKWLSLPKRKSNRRQNRNLNDKVDARVNQKQRYLYFNRNRNESRSFPKKENMSDWNLFMLTNNAKNKQDGEVTSEELKVEQEDMYDDLPVDILEILDSPTPNDCSMMNLANIRDTGKKNFIQCGTNITSSIWSIEPAINDNNYNTLLDNPFGIRAATNDDLEKIWSNPVQENATNLFFETYRNNLPFFENSDTDYLKYINLSSKWDPKICMAKFEQWSEAENFEDKNVNNMKKSLMQLNHNTEKSCFIEVVPKSTQKLINCGEGVGAYKPVNAVKPLDTEKAEESLLTSMKSHFKPINSAKTIVDQSCRQYADGTTFPVSNSLDKPKYKRTHSGSLFVELEYGSPKKYFEYKSKNNTEFGLKFIGHQNDKSCQTDGPFSFVDGYEGDESQEVPCKRRVLCEGEDVYFPGDKKSLLDETDCACLTKINAMPTDNSSGNHCTFQSDSISNEVNWNDDAVHCENCRSSYKSWGSNWVKEKPNNLDWEFVKNATKSIWSGGDVCSTCLELDENKSVSNYQKSKLREDISQDGEQLLSDLSCLQKSYMEQVPASEISYDISELLTGNTERKRRHSPTTSDLGKGNIPLHGSWSIPSQVKHDRFVQVASVPVLHSVTL